ncbi:migration and invasion enhancer 1 [Prinia subflava]|uniref:migration and invasion enhancer 1 n=1 Tax=Prinia subflava TaxID=208062 RepID=UPI002FE27D67
MATFGGSWPAPPHRPGIRARVAAPAAGGEGAAVGTTASPPRWHCHPVSPPTPTATVPGHRHRHRHRHRLCPTRCGSTDAPHVAHVAHTWHLRWHSVATGSFCVPRGSPGSRRLSRRSRSRQDEQRGGAERPEAARHVTAPGSGGAAGPGAMSGGAESATGDGNGAESGAERPVRIVVEYCEPCGFEATYQELASAVREEYPDIEIESRLGPTGAFEIEINGQLIFSKLENGGFPYEKDLIEAIRRARNGEPLEKITNSRPPCVIL